MTAACQSDSVCRPSSLVEIRLCFAMMSSRASFCVCSLIQRLFVVLLLLSPEASKSFFCIRYPVLRGFHGLFQSHGGRHFSSATDSDDTAHDAIISNTTLNRPLDNLAVSLNGNNRASQRQRIPILEYFPHWVAVNKPAGMTMHAGGPKQKGPQLKSTLKKQLSRKIWLGKFVRLFFGRFVFYSLEGSC